MAVGATLLNGYLSTVKLRGADTARSDAVSARTELTIGLTTAGQPLVTALPEVCSACAADEADNAVDVLVAKSVGIVQQQCGRTSGTRGQTRAAFYLLDQNRLVRRRYEGRDDGTPPRLTFTARQVPGARRAIETVRGERVIFRPGPREGRRPGTSPTCAAGRT